MNKYEFKNCTRCGGDVLIERSEYGWHVNCPRCGYEYDLKYYMAELEAQNIAFDKEPVTVEN